MIEELIALAVAEGGGLDNVIEELSLWLWRRGELGQCD